MDNNTIGKDDFKYVIGDYSTTHIGSRFSYEEMLMHERVPFKFQSIVEMYVIRKGEIDPSTVLADHLLTLKDDIVGKAYTKLKMKITFCEPKKRGGYKVRSMYFPAFMKYRETNWTDNHMIQEITISNLALMSFML